MSLLEKVNQKATMFSVLKRAMTSGVVGAVLAGAVMAFGKRAQSSGWVLGLVLWVLLCMIVGAVIEWQVPDEDASQSDA